MEVKARRALKFERIRQQFGCGYYAVCCGNSCPCSLKHREYDQQTYQELKDEFDAEERELFGA